ncbi:MFS transporter [Pantoea sp. A4]|uniref:MFS transporter n=1 Tax=Pantoea sp. A4 TaxID=1225184 RepID=UPI00036761D6|nr:MFS transporter [Pantoea sp. A4]
MRPSYQPRLVQVASCMAFVIVLLDVSVVNVALEALRHQFSSDMAGLQWIVNAYALVFSALLLSAGLLADRFGSKRLFILGFALFTVSSVGCGFASSLSVLIAFRSLQGVGAALLIPTSLTLLREAFSTPDARARAIGWWGAGGGIALAAGPVIGGLLLSSFGWRAIFLLNFPLGIAGLWLAQRYAAPSPTQAGKSVDLPGQLSGAFALGCLTFSLTEASRYGWQHPLIIGCFVASLLLGGVFVRTEARSPDPMLPLSLFRRPNLAASTFIGLVANLTFYGMVFVFSLYFQHIRHFSAAQTGVAFLPMMGILMVMNVVAGRLMTRRGVRELAVSGLLISASGYLLMLLALPGGEHWTLIIPMLLAGSGIALAIPTITHAVLAAAPAHQSDVAGALLNTARQTGGVIGVALFGYMIRHSEKVAFMAGMQLSIAISAGLLLLAAGFGWMTLTTAQKPSMVPACDP